MAAYHQEIRIPAGPRIVPADLIIPPNATGIVIFSHAGIGTLLPDLLIAEEIDRSKEFDISLLTSRLMAVTRWLLNRDLFGHYRHGYYATSTGAAVALQAAVGLDDIIGAVVCRGGRVDLAIEAVPEVQSPVLLIVGSLDKYVLQLNREAIDAFSCEKQLTIVQGATHFFAGTKIEEVGALARSWFGKHLKKQLHEHAE